MAYLARADLEALLRARNLDTTLTSPGEPANAEGVSFGLARLDGRLGGGLPAGQLSELVGPRSSGRLALLCRLMATATTRGDLAALIDPLDMFDPGSGSAAGIDLTRVLWVRGPAVGHLALPSGRRPGPGPDLLAAALDRGLKAFNLVLQAGGFAVVGLDLGELPVWVTRRVPLTTWVRLQRVLEGSTTAGVLLAREPLARSAAGVSVRLTPSSPDGGMRIGEAECGIRAVPGRWNGPPRQARLFEGIEIEAQVAGTRLKWMDDGSAVIRMGAGAEGDVWREA